MSSAALKKVEAPPPPDDVENLERAVAPVTIVMSNYNHARYLEESLRGLVGQTLPAEKILVIDDGSTDNSVEIIRRYERDHSNLRLIRNKVNLGLQDSIARVLPLISSDYLVWAASDDKLLPDFLERSMAEFAKHPDAGLCFSELTVLIDETGEVQRFAMEPSVSHIFNLSDLPRYMPPQAVEARMKRSYFPVSGNTVVANRSKLAQCGNFFKDLQWHSDHFAFNILALRYGACVVPDTLGLIRQRADSYSASGMRSLATQRPVLEAMLAILARDDFADVRHALQRAPSFYSVWGTAVLRLMMKRSSFWPTAARYTAWKYKQFRLGYNLTHAQAFARLARRVARTAVPRRVQMPVFGKKKRELEAQIHSLATERDGLIAERDRLGQAVHETAQQHDAAKAEIGRLNGELTRFSSELEAARTDIARLGSELSELQKDLKKNQLDLKLALSDRDTAREQLAETKDKLQTATKERDEATTQLRASRQEIESIEKEREKIQSQFDEQKEVLAREIERREIHTGPYNEGLFAPDTVIYEDDEVRPEYIVPLTTLPKSGTYYLSRLFSEGLNLRPLIVSNQYFPHDTIYQPRLREFIKGGYVSQDHFPASQINVTHLAHLLEKVVVQTRDPRQAMLSYVHFLSSEAFVNNIPETRRFVYPTLPENFYELELARQLDWGIEYWLPELVTWIREWQDADANSTLSVLFTRFEDLVTDESALVHSILDFLEIPQDAYASTKIELDSSVHFRAGQSDEWRKTLTANQIGRANELIPDDMKERFGWPD